MTSESSNTQDLLYQTLPNRASADEWDIRYAAELDTGLTPKCAARHKITSRVGSSSAANRAPSSRSVFGRGSCVAWICRPRPRNKVEFTCDGGCGPPGSATLHLGISLGCPWRRPSLSERGALCDVGDPKVQPAPDRSRCPRGPPRAPARRRARSFAARRLPGCATAALPHTLARLRCGSSWQTLARRSVSAPSGACCTRMPFGPDITGVGSSRAILISWQKPA